MSGNLADFMGAAPSVSTLTGNTAWAARYAEEIKRIVREAANNADRTVLSRTRTSKFVHVGPSELGVVCDRQTAGKLAGLPSTNHVADPWPSVVGTAVHAWLADAFLADNDRAGRIRWLTEQKVHPHPDHPGTADLYDALELAVGDHKVLGVTSMDKVKSAGGPPRKYIVQMLLYARGYRALGLPVNRVALIAYPRTKSTLDGVYVWERPYTPADDALLAEVFLQTAYRKKLAEALMDGRLPFNQIPKSPDDDECYFCPFYRPEAKNGGAGCPGAVSANN